MNLSNLIKYINFKWMRVAKLKIKEEDEGRKVGELPLTDCLNQTGVDRYFTVCRLLGCEK